MPKPACSPCAEGATSFAPRTSNPMYNTHVPAERGFLECGGRTLAVPGLCPHERKRRPGGPSHGSPRPLSSPPQAATSDTTMQVCAVNPLPHRQQGRPEQDGLGRYDTHFLLRGESYAFRMRRRSTIPSAPMPSRAIVAGSGTMIIWSTDPRKLIVTSASGPSYPLSFLPRGCRTMLPV
jgi:hypothetical protein